MVSFKKSFLERKGEEEERREVGGEGKRKNVPVLNEVVVRKKKVLSLEENYNSNKGISVTLKGPRRS